MGVNKKFYGICNRNKRKRIVFTFVTTQRIDFE